MPPVRYAAAYGACGERRSKPNIKAVCSAQRVSELFVLQDLVRLVGRSESCSPGLRTGVGSQAATCPGLPASLAAQRVVPLFDRPGRSRFPEYCSIATAPDPGRIAVARPPPRHAEPPQTSQPAEIQRRSQAKTAT